MKRLATREYLPMAAWVAGWALIGFALGHADAIRLLAANTFVQAARGVAALEISGVLHKRRGGDPEVLRLSRRRAAKIDGISLLAALLLLAGLVGLLQLREMEKLALMIALVSIGLPARHPLGLLIVDRQRSAPWRLGAALVGVTSGAVVLLLDLGWIWAAVLFGLRDWGGLLLTRLFGRTRRLPREPLAGTVSFHEMAARTEAGARRRLTYRISKSLLGALLGPFGGVMARTGRGANIDSRLTSLIPRNRLGMTALTIGTVGGGIALLLISREPASILLSAALLRIGGSAASALIWWNYGGGEEIDEDEDDD